MPGSFHYCAPENFRFKYEDGTYEDDVNSDSDSECEDKGDTHIELTIKADIWAVGIILYKMVYDGVHPYAAVCGGRSSTSTDPSEVGTTRDWRTTPLPLHLV